MFKNHLPKKYQDEAPRLVHNPDGSDTWRFRDVVIANIALIAMAGRPKDEYGLEPQGLDEIRPGCWQVDERIKDMNAGGILGSTCFPSFPGFPGRLFATEDPEFSLALLQAYNDWHVEEWCGAYPARFIPICLPAIWDAEACAKEVRRTAKRGVHALTFTENPSAMGYPSFHDDYWMPLWEALVDTDTVMNVHIGSSGRLAITAPDAPIDVLITLQPMNIVQAAADLLWSKPIRKYPTSRSRCPRAAPAGFRISWNAPIAPMKCTPPGPGRTSAASCRPNKITFENAMRWYHFDPFTTSVVNKPPSAPCARPPKTTASPSRPVAPRQGQPRRRFGGHRTGELRRLTRQRVHAVVTTPRSAAAACASLTDARRHSPIPGCQQSGWKAQRHRLPQTAMARALTVSI
jgi:hypothetical protein